MKKLYKIFYWILFCFAIILTIGSILSVLRNIDSQFLKVLDFARIQFFLSALIGLIIFLLINRSWGKYDYFMIAGFVATMTIQSFYLIHYTPIVPKKVPDATTDNVEDDRISLVLMNVKMKNKNAQPIIDQIREIEPDLFLAMEVNQWWNDQLKVIEKEYPYSRKVLNELTYGMSLYSKFPFKKININYLQNKNVPSFESIITLDNGKDIRLYTIHPVPPIHFEHLPDNEGQREIAMKKLGEKIENKELPTIVAGDINDVVWSYTDGLTGTNDKLLDVRIGRGFYNSFNAHNFLTRWPLDHVFVTKEFMLNKIERLPKTSSDHFGIYVELAL
ncbi:endonuclease/exonuclease/phosphatase family protein [Mangrovivirga sp. M17]|uniref:Endonuclease/exonuclease/phosphatase family protein n=1 Tax=Mangrovivirga halotolerans TaxID=2993936 RepID=A0ABT3RPE4_9BACT|nr:endonuclease/exonuclease/phosphatase family protein [Mangrovivirga halotolerans]MCX2743218.1 endonuclease/exonuclease/phosphatase family protein [Mangrovivirga halotolerans]